MTDRAEYRKNDEIILEKIAGIHDDVLKLKTEIIGIEGGRPGLAQIVADNRTKLDEVDQRVANLERIKYALHIVWGLIAAMVAWKERLFGRSHS